MEDKTAYPVLPVYGALGVDGLIICLWTLRWIWKFQVFLVMHKAISKINWGSWNETKLYYMLHGLFSTFFFFLNMTFIRIDHVEYVISVLLILQNLAGAQLLQTCRSKSSIGVQIQSNILYVTTVLWRNKRLSFLSFICVSFHTVNAALFETYSQAAISS